MVTSDGNKSILWLPTLDNKNTIVHCIIYFGLLSAKMRRPDPSERSVTGMRHGNSSGPTERDGASGDSDRSITFEAHHPSPRAGRWRSVTESSASLIGVQTDEKTVRNSATDSPLLSANP